MEHRLRVSISLALSALLTQAIYADVCPNSSGSSQNLTVNAGETCTISSNQEVQDTVTNNGTIIFNSSSKLTFSNGTSNLVTVTSDTDRGSIQVVGTSTIDSDTKPLTIEGQDININEYRTLTIKTNTLTLGDDSKFTTITGNSTNVTNTSTWGITLDTTTELKTKNVSFKDIRLSGSALTTLTNTNSTFENTHISSEKDLTISTDNSSKFKILGKSNTISSGTKNLNIEGTHTFSGNGLLDFNGGTITLGNDTSATLVLSSDTTTTLGDKKETPTLGFVAETKVLFKNLVSSDLTLEIVKSGNSGATLHNVKSTFTNGTLQALDRDNKDQILVIQNGDSTLATIGKIAINKGTTTFKGSGIKIYGQEIELKNTGDTTLTLNTIEDSGEIYLGKEDTQASGGSGTNKDGEVTIKGRSSGSGKQTLQLRALTTTFGGNVTLENLAVSTQAKNTQADEGMIFSLAKDSIVELSGVTITSGIDKDYQDLSFTTLEGTSTLNVKDKDSTIKASTLSFINQTIDLANASAGKALNLYAYGNTALTNESGIGVGHFAFADTTIQNGSSAKLNLYSADHAKVLANNLTLDNLTLATYKINGTTNKKNALDLSDTSSSITTQGAVTIDTEKFLYGTTQGVGADLTIVGNGGTGKLTLKSDTKADNFTFGGTLTIDNSSASSGVPKDSQLEIELGSNKASEAKVDFSIDGGLTAIGSTSSTITTKLKAKSFTFGKGSIVSSINGTLQFETETSFESINIKDGLTRLYGRGNATGKITTPSGGALTLGNVEAQGKTEIENATFSDSNITIRSIDDSNKTLTIKGTTTIEGIKSIDIKDAGLEIKNSGSNADLQLNVDGSITSNGISTITASKITTQNSGTYSINVESGTLTLAETSSAGDKIGNLTLGVKDKQGGNLQLTNNTSNTFHDFKALNITSYKDSSITAKTFAFADNKAEISSIGGELKLSAKDTSTDALTLKEGNIELNNGTLSYYYLDSSTSKDTLGKMKLYDDTSGTPTKSVTITSQGTSAIKASELELKGNTITSSGGVLTLYGVKNTSEIGTMTINNAGGVTVTKQGNHDDLEAVKLSSTLTLTANAPYVSSTSPLGGGKFGVLQAQKVEFTQNGGKETPLVNIKVFDKPLQGEELFTLQEGGQIVVWTTGGITKNSGKAITLDDISVDSGGYKSLSLTAQLLPDTTTATQINAIQVNLSVIQNSASELTEGIGDETAKKQMQAILGEGSNKTIIDSILGSSSNPLKAGFAENIIQGNTVVVSNALDYIDDAFNGISQSMHLNDRIQTQIVGVQTSIIEGRLARQGNPHHATAELAKFIRSYHNTRYASSDDELFAEEEPSQPSKGSLWVSYDGGLATGNGSNSTINGLSAGYDHSLSSQFLLGGFINYAYGAFDGTYIHNNSHNIGLGLYTRMYFGNNEVDLVLSENIGLVTSQVNVGNTTMPSLLNGTMQYNLYRTNVMTRYGYTFKVGDEESPYYLKPIVGVNMSYTYQDDSETDAVASVTMSKVDFFKLDMSVGMEMRKYINEGTYLFIMPLIERDIFANSCDVNVGFVDGQNLSYTLDYLSQTSVSVYAGGEGNLTENLALSGSLGVKVGIEKSEVLTNWSVGLKYKF